MKCAVIGCYREAAADCGFQQIGSVGEMEIKTSGLLCKICFQQAMNGGSKTEETPKQEYCAGCGIAFWKRITGEPVLTHMLNGEKYCTACFERRQQDQQDYWEKLFSNQTYSSQGHYTFSYDRMEEDIARMRYFYGSFNSSSSSTAGQQQTRTQYLPTEIKEAFKILGIEPVKDMEAIKKAYKALALVFHPDTGGDHASMVKLNKAKDVALKWAEGK